MKLICEVNDRMAESYERLPMEGPKAFICECGAHGCTGRVWLTLDEYGAIRAHPERFAIAPDHGSMAESVLERREQLVLSGTAA